MKRIAMRITTIMSSPIAKDVVEEVVRLLAQSKAKFEASTWPREIQPTTVAATDAANVTSTD